MTSTPTLASHFGMLARYNSIVNKRLLEACSRLSVQEYRAERSGSFGSVHRTLNHILLGDRVWMDRFTASRATSTPALNTILYEDFDELRAARYEEDVRIAQFMDGLTGDFLLRDIHYINNAGIHCADPVPLLLAHFFNHQTHHRGQIHTMLNKSASQALSLDMHRAIRPLD